MIFATDIHGALVRARVLKQTILQAGADRSLLILGGDLTSFQGIGRARTVLTELALSFQRVLAIPGNTDLPEVGPWLADLGLSIDGRAAVVDGVGFIGCGGSNRTPMHTPNERDEDQIASCLDAAFQDLQDRGGAHKVVVVSHCPPRDTAADRLHGGGHVGSTALRTFLETHEVDLCLCGHIHESVGLEHLGRTLVCNPGALAWGRYVSVHWDDDAPVCELKELRIDAVSGFVEGAVGAVRKLTGYAAWRFRDVAR